MTKVILILTTILITSCNGFSSKTCTEGNCENGYGIMIWNDGAILEGTWTNGLLNGAGIQSFGVKSPFVGDSYSGEFKNNEYEGKGTYYDLSEDSEYVGEWKNGRPHGKGRVDFREKSKYPNRYYDGQWKQGERNGFGEKFWGEAGEYTSNRYQGQWKKNDKHGIGRYDWPDGSYYTGSWLNDEQHGKGTYVFKNGEVFNGEWTHGYCLELAQKMGLE